MRSSFITFKVKDTCEIKFKFIIVLNMITTFLSLYACFLYKGPEIILNAKVNLIYFMSFENIKKIEYFLHLLSTFFEFLAFFIDNKKKIFNFFIM